MSLWARLCSASDPHKNYKESDGWILEKEQKPLQKGVLVQQSHGMSSAAVGYPGSVRVVPVRD